MKYDIPINISVDATNEFRAENQVIEFLTTAFKEYTNDYRLLDFELFEFVASKPCNTGCGDNNIHEGQCSCCQ